MVLVQETVKLGYYKFIFEQYQRQKLTDTIFSGDIVSYYLSNMYYMPGPMPRHFGDIYLFQVTIQTSWCIRHFTDGKTGSEKLRPHG